MRMHLSKGRNVEGTGVTEASILGEKKDFHARSILTTFMDPHCKRLDIK